MTHDDFLQEILANPDDDAPRLIYADWLDENGDSLQAEFIRAQCELAKLPRDDPRYREAQKREHVVRLKYAPIWRQSLPGWTWHFRIRPRRGFGAIVYTTIPYFAKSAAKLFKSFPVQHAEFTGGEPYLQRFLECWHIGHLRTLDILSCQFTEASYRALADCRGLSGLAGLALRRAVNLDMAAAELLMNSPHLQNLRTIYCPDIDPRIKEYLSERFRFEWLGV